MKWLLSSITLCALLLSGQALADGRSYSNEGFTIKVSSFQPVTNKYYYNGRYYNYDRYDRRYDRRDRRYDRRDRRFDRRDRRYDRREIRRDKRRSRRNDRFCY